MFKIILYATRPVFAEDVYTDVIYVVEVGGGGWRWRGNLERMIRRVKKYIGKLKNCIYLIKGNQTYTAVVSHQRGA